MSVSPHSSKKSKVSPKARSTTNRSTLRPEDVCVGCILWLPERLENSMDIRCSRTGELLEREGYDHPVVVLGVMQHGNSGPMGELVISIALVTSFDSVTLSEYLMRRGRRYRQSIPILSNTDEDPPHRALFLEGKRTLRKQSYVRLQNIYNVPLSLLRAYAFTGSRAYHWRLDNESYNTLMVSLSLEPQHYPSTNTLWEKSSDRLDLNSRELPSIAGPSSQTSSPPQCLPQSPIQYLRMPPHPSIDEPLLPPRTSIRPAARPYFMPAPNNDLPDLRNYGSITSELPLHTPRSTSRDVGYVRKAWGQAVRGMKRIWDVASPWLQVLVGGFVWVLVGCAVWKLWLVV